MKARGDEAAHGQDKGGRQRCDTEERIDREQPKRHPETEQKQQTETRARCGGEEDNGKGRVHRLRPVSATAAGRPSAVARCSPSAIRARLRRRRNRAYG